MLRSAVTSRRDASERSLSALPFATDEIPEQRRSLNALEHRPWPLPRRPWLMGQTWNRLLFAHWRVDTTALRGQTDLPAGHILAGQPVKMHVRGA
jgi:hypothetical protein